MRIVHTQYANPADHPMQTDDDGAADAHGDFELGRVQPQPRATTVVQRRRRLRIALCQGEALAIEEDGLRWHRRDARCCPELCPGGQRCELPAPVGLERRRKFMSPPSVSLLVVCCVLPADYARMSGCVFVVCSSYCCLFLLCTRKYFLETRVL